MDRFVPDYATNPEPIDALDAACEIHDCCLANAQQAAACLSECHNGHTCKMVAEVDCEQLYPRPDQSVEMFECMKMKNKFLTSFCPGVAK